MFNASHPVFLVPTNSNGKNNKKDNSNFFVGAVLLAPPKYGGVGEFSFGSSLSSAINCGTGYVSGDMGV